MNSQAYIYKTNGEIIPVLPSNRSDFSLSELQSFVNGSIEIVYLDDATCMIVNEEGKLLDLKPNVEATRLYSLSKGNFDFICGNALVTPCKYIK
jgi:hypothetical protein